MVLCATALGVLPRLNEASVLSLCANGMDGAVRYAASLPHVAYAEPLHRMRLRWTTSSRWHGQGRQDMCGATCSVPVAVVTERKAPRLSANHGSICRRIRATGGPRFLQVAHFAEALPPSRRFSGNLSMAGNANSGRRPAPTALTVLRGNPSRKKLNENEPRPPSGAVVKPAGLSVAGGAVWDELAPVCLAMRTLTVADQRSFATMCELQATFQQAAAGKDGRELFRLEQPDEDTPQMMVVMVDAILKLERETAAALRPYYELFGLTPAARARISVPQTEAPQSKWADALQ
jgi:hypothetical protein